MKTIQPVTTSSVSQRIASIDWMRRPVMVIMLVDHASMALRGNKLLERLW
jgi:uncharacterized membrane protein